MYRFEVTALAGHIFPNVKTEDEHSIHEMLSLRNCLSTIMPKNTLTATKAHMHRDSPGFIEKHDHESCAAECAMYPTKKHSFMATRWPLIQTQAHGVSGGRLVAHVGT